MAVSSRRLIQSSLARKKRWEHASLLARQVHAFHLALKLPTSEGPPHVISDDRMRVRLRLIAGEFCELLEAALEHYPKADELRRLLASVISGAVNVDLPEFVDAMADLDYVVQGTRDEMGVDGVPVAREVHRTNMAKVGGVIVEGKLMKPAGWKPPDIAEVLRAQGWKP